jgi:hypothetical protein
MAKHYVTVRWLRGQPEPQRILADGTSEPQRYSNDGPTTHNRFKDAVLITDAKGQPCWMVVKECPLYRAQDYAIDLTQHLRSWGISSVYNII